MLVNLAPVKLFDLSVILSRYKNLNFKYFTFEFPFLFPLSIFCCLFGIDVESLPIPPRPSFFKSLNAANNANQSSLPTANNNHSHPSSPPTYSRIQQQANNRDSPKFSSGRPPPPYPTRTSSSSLQQRPLPVPNVGSGNRSSSINERGNVTTFFQNRGEYFLNEKKIRESFQNKKSCA